MSKKIKILLATDFTEASDNALNYADALFRNWYGLDVKYLLVHAFKPLVPYSNTPSMPVMTNNKLDSELKKKLKQLAADLRKRLNDENAIQTHFEHGSLNEVIQKIIRDEQPDLIVMGTREKSAFQRMTVGTNTMEVASTVSCPVLAVAKEATPDTVINMVLATDLKDFSISPLSSNLLERLANFKESKLQVLHVFPSKKEAEQSKRMEHLDFHNHLAYIKHEHVSIVGKDTSEGIISFVNEHQSDLLILALGERSFLEKIFHNDKTEKMVYHADVPVLILN